MSKMEISEIERIVDENKFTPDNFEYDGDFDELNEKLLQMVIKSDPSEDMILEHIKSASDRINNEL